MNDDGTMARVPDLVEFCNHHQFKMLTVAELIRFRLQHERYIFRVAESIVPTRFGDFRMIAYESEVDGGESHLALVRGEVSSELNPDRFWCESTHTAWREMSSAPRCAIATR